MRAPSLVIVGAEKGGVGKTTVARTLIEYFLIRNFDVRAYDTEYPLGELRRYHPDITKIINIRDTRDQCLLLDELDGSNDVTVVDLKAGELTRTFDFLADVGAFEAAAQGSLNLTVLHLLGSSVASLEELAATEEYSQLCNYYIVKNLANARFFTQNKAELRKLAGDSKEKSEILIPNLNAFAYENVEIEGLPFSSYVLNNDTSSQDQGRSFVLRGYVKTWLERVWDNYENAGLDSLVRVRSDHENERA